VSAFAEAPERRQLRFSAQDSPKLHRMNRHSKIRSSCLSSGCPSSVTPRGRCWPSFLARPYRNCYLSVAKSALSLTRISVVVGGRTKVFQDKLPMLLNSSGPALYYGEAAEFRFSSRTPNLTTLLFLAPVIDSRSSSGGMTAVLRELPQPSRLILSFRALDPDESRHSLGVSSYYRPFIPTFTLAC